MTARGVARSEPPADPARSACAPASPAQRRRAPAARAPRPRWRACRGARSAGARPTSGRPSRRPERGRSGPGRAAPARRSSSAPMPGIARSRRQPRSWSGARRSTRPLATSRAALDQRQRAAGAEVERLQQRRRRARERRGVGRSRRPLRGQRRPRRPTIRRSIATARRNSISCSQIAQASASNGSRPPPDAQVRPRAQRGPDERVVAEGVPERAQVVVDRRARSACGRSPASATARPVARARRPRDLRRKTTRSRARLGRRARRRGGASTWIEPLEQRAAAPHHTVAAGARQPERPRRA